MVRECARTPRESTLRGRAQFRGNRAQYGGAASYPDYRAAIDDPKIDAVVVAVPPAFHLALTRQALAAGKHVLVEKPAFPRTDDYAAAAAARFAGDASMTPPSTIRCAAAEPLVAAPRTSHEASAPAIDPLPRRPTMTTSSTGGNEGGSYTPRPGSAIRCPKMAKYR